jgi:hypothetical protein
MVVYESDLKKQAISAMEHCMAYITVGDMKRAHQSYGEARAYEDMLTDEGIDLELENEHYREMKSIYYFNK